MGTGEDEEEQAVHRAGLFRIHQEIASLHDQAALLHDRFAEYLDGRGAQQEAREQRQAARLDKLKAKYEWDTTRQHAQSPRVERSPAEGR